MPSLNEQYPPEQRQNAITDFKTGLLAVLAGPGTGKTFGLISRIKQLLAEGVAEDDIIYVSFTNEIVRKFSDDLTEEFEKRGEVSPSIRTWTLHSLAWRVLRNLGHHINLPAQTALYDLDEDDILGEIILSDLRTGLSSDSRPLPAVHCKALLDQYREARRKLVPKAQWSQGLLAFIRLLLKVNGELQALDWDSVLPAATKVIEKEGSVPEWLRRIPHVLADEYQDFNPAEHALLHLVSAGADSRVLVGDQFQSIYGRRGASPDLLVGLANDPNHCCLNLVRCRRCPVAVIEGANRVLAAMAGPDFAEVALQPHDPARIGSLEIFELPSAKQEVEYLAGRIRAWHAATNSYRDIIGLCASREQAQLYSRLLRKAGIPCDSPADRSVTREWLKVAVRHLAVPAHPLWQRALLAKFHLPSARYFKGIRPRLAAVDGSVRQATMEAAANSGWSRPCRTQAQAYQALLEDLSSRDPERCLSALENISGVALTGKLSKVEELLALPLEDLDARRDSIIDSLLGFAPPTEDDRVRIMTMHASKGLDRKHVFIPACEKGVYPGFSSSIDEQRRLFYVGATRAKDGLLITYPTSRDSTRSMKRPHKCEYVLSEFAALMGVAVTRVR